MLSVSLGHSLQCAPRSCPLTSVDQGAVTDGWRLTPARSVTEAGAEIQEALKQRTGQNTVPNVFVNGEHVGGCDDTLQVSARGQGSQRAGQRAPRAGQGSQRAGVTEGRAVVTEGRAGVTEGRTEVTEQGHRSAGRDTDRLEEGCWRIGRTASILALGKISGTHFFSFGTRRGTVHRTHLWSTKMGRYSTRSYR